MSSEQLVADVIPVETLTPNEVISCLYSKNSTEKCRIGLADAVVYEFGLPTRWYMTGKTGEILKKRGLDRVALSQRWLRISAQNQSPYVAILRQEGGLYKFLSESAWNEFIATDPMPDPSIVSLHCFVKGNNNLVYRNKFELRDRLGRFTTSTQSYTFFDPNEPMADSVVLAREQRFTFTESRATALKNIMDLATNTVIRYLEMMLSVKVMSLSIDYVIDTKSQLWMLWPSAAKIVRDKKLWEDVKLVPGLEDKDAPDRMSWATLPPSDSPGRLKTLRRQGEAAAVAATGGGGGGGNADRRKAKSPSTAVRNKAMDDRHTVSSRGKAVSTGFDFLGDETAPGDGEARKGGMRREQLEAADASAHISAATNVLDGAAAKAMAKSNRLGSVSANYLVNEGHRPAAGAKVTGGDDGNFSANPFKCRGDYCRVRLQTAGALYTEATAEVHTSDSFFSSHELDELRKDPNCRDVMGSASGREGPSMDMISMRSIRLARSERRGGMGEAGGGGGTSTNSWDEYPQSPRSLRAKRGLPMADAGDADGAAETKGALSDAQLEEARKHRDEFTKGMAVHYEQVRVCGVCSNIYRMLDWARAVLNHDNAVAAEIASKGGGNRRASSRGRRSKRGEESSAAAAGSNGNVDKAAGSSSSSSGVVSKLLRPDRPNSKASPTRRPQELDPLTTAGGDARHHRPPSGTQVSSPTRGKGGKNEKDKRTWKDYVASAERDGGVVGVSDAPVAMGAGFVELDDYLRGGAQQLAARKERERKTLARKRVHRLMPMEGDSGNLGGGAKLLSRVQAEHAGRSRLDGGDSSIYASDGDDDDDKYGDGLYHGRVLIACEEGSAAREAIEILEGAGFYVYWARDGRDAINAFTSRASGGRLDAMSSSVEQPPASVSGNDNRSFDCVLVQRDLPLVNAFQIAESVRMVEKAERKAAAAEAAAAKRGVQPPTRRYPVICYTTATSPEDLKAYMKADMDGCVSYPVNHMSLLNTVRAAVPQHMAMVATSLTGPPAPDPSLAASALLRPAPGPKAYKLGSLGEMEGSTDSSTMAAKSMSFVAGNADDECAINGVVQIDADTRVPYMVMDASRNAKVLVNPNKPFFNIVVCNDLFDTAERLKIFFRPLVQRYLGLQILLWNYPGQAFTEWREEQLLNNEYHAACLNEVLGQVGERGTKDFDTSKPFYLMGVGHGASVSTFYASHYRVPNMRGLLSFNGWAFVDSYLAGIMHDCINVFQNSPASRPDLPVYFFSRFLFSKEYLARVSVPLALNLYTAVHNPISLAGRISLCKGVLQAVDVRPLMREIDCPVICVHSTQNSLARPVHAEPFVQYRGGEVRSIFKALKDPFKTCLVWMKSGHELFQECKKPTQTLLEQIVTGFFENHDISFPSAPAVDKASVEQQGTIVSNLPWEPDKKIGKTIEDKFIDSVLDNMGKQSTSHPSPGKKSGESLTRSGNASPTQRSPSQTHGDGRGRGGGTPSPGRTHGRGGSSTSPGRNVAFTANDPNAWEAYSSAIAEGQVLGKLKDKAKKKKEKAANVGMIFDHTSAMFDKQEKHRGEPGAPANAGQNIHEFPEVKEYMAWRLKRNKKRLQRLQGAARIIQGTFRAYMARQYVINMRRKKAAIQIQRCFRGWLGRLAFLDRARRIWATLLLQRAWRGYVARKQFYFRKLRVAAACNIQRVVRGYLARKFVREVRAIRDRAATIIQALFRRVQARKIAWRLRLERNSAIPIQRVFRGHLGRRRAQNERDKYIFSRSQSQGIEFGRQMLLEHKLHATKLQSDVTLLTQEKMSAEEQVEALLEEISGFEEGVRTLEKEMHQLSKVESEAAAYMDDESKYELREQKIRLDKEFGEMLGKIGGRKEMLLDLEAKLSAIDKARQTKEEELRMLERKLVVLLEEQQNELDAIKRKQDLRSTMGDASGGGEGGGPSTALVVAGAAGSGGGGGGSGPSLQEKRQAAQLMQSTETLMKFGFMSMSMTYFSSLNMIKALRTVSAQDTVMAALADVQAQRASAALGVPNGAGGGGVLGVSAGGSLGKNQFLPDLKGGQLGGQEALRVSAWSVEDVAKWLHTLSLGQYAEAFIDAAIDGEFLYDINDDDLKNTLGIEHRLHRKKILNCVHRLKIAETQRDSRLNVLLRETGSMDAPSLDADDDGGRMQVTFPGELEKVGPGDNWRQTDGPKVPLSELFSYVRNSKISLLKAALDYLPTKKFDKSLVQSPYVVDNGTVYVDGYERLLFHINKTDDFGNTLLSISCQNGNSKTCKYLVAKGANPNHQNNAGQTPGHFAVAFKSFELAKWLYENGADDTVENKFGLVSYDGLVPEGVDG